MERIETSGTGIAYEAVGDGPTLLLTHGYAASSHMFRADAAALADVCRVVTWDIRGHGSSDSPDDLGEYSVAASVDDMAAVLDAVGAETAIIGGHSLGGFLSLSFAIAHRQRVEALVLIDTGPGYRQAEPRESWNAMANRFADNFDARGFEGHNGGDEFDPSVHRGGAGGLARAARGILTQHDSSVIDSLPTIAVPTLVIVGERDTPFLGGSQYMAAKIPDATLVMIPGAGHAPNVTHPQEFDAAVRSFVGRLTR